MQAKIAPFHVRGAKWVEKERKEYYKIVISIQHFGIQDDKFTITKDKILHTHT